MNQAFIGNSELPNTHNNLSTAFQYNSKVNMLTSQPYITPRSDANLLSFDSDNTLDDEANDFTIPESEYNLNLVRGTSGITSLN